MKRWISALALAGALASGPLSAHHSFDGTFDRNKVVNLSGTVTEFRFANPHSYIELAVIGADGQTQVWHVETTSAGSLANHGWTARSITPGEKLEIDAWPARNGTPYVKLHTMHHAGGSPIALWLPPGPTPLPGA